MKHFHLLLAALIFMGVLSRISFLSSSGDSNPTARKFLSIANKESNTPEKTIPVNHTKAGKPDILFFIADDMTSIDCEPYGNKDVKTPNLAKLAGEGMCFDNMYNATALCGPTRQSFYTGIYPVKIRSPM